MLLPDQDYLSVLELCRRWGCDRSQIVRYIDTRKIKAAIEYNGRLEAVSHSDSNHRVTADSRLVVYLPDSLIPRREITPEDVAFCYSLESPNARPEMEAINRLRRDLKANAGDWRILLQWRWTARERAPENDWMIPHPEIARLEREYGLTKKAPNQNDKPLDTRERTTLLTLVAVLGKAAGIDIEHPTAATVIEKLTEEIGARVASSTIGRHLKSIPDALERRKK